MTTAKIIQLIGASSKGWEEATKVAIADAAKTVKNIKTVHLKRCTAKIENNKIVEYYAEVEIAFLVKRET